MMKSWDFKHYLVWAARLCVAGLFVYAGLLKVVNPSAFLADIENYRLLPYGVAVATALYLPFVEITAGIGMLVAPLRREAVLLLGSMLIVFIVAIASAWARGLDITCGCFGGSQDEPASYTWLIFRDLLILGAVVLGGVRPHAGGGTVFPICGNDLEVNAATTERRPPMGDCRDETLSSFPQKLSTPNLYNPHAHKPR